MKQKAFFIIFKELLIVRNCLRSKSGPLSCSVTCEATFTQLPLYVKSNLH